MKTLKWNTQLVNEFLYKLENGEVKIEDGPFYKNNTSYRKANIIYEYTKDELIEIYKSAKNVLYFAEHYAHVMTDEGVRLIKLRNYQEKILKGFSDPEKRFHILLASRQVGKCITYNTKLNVNNNYVSIGKLYYENLKKQRELSLLEKIKMFIYNQIDKLENYFFKKNI
jgi:hypothetical protein